MSRNPKITSLKSLHMEGLWKGEMEPNENCVTILIIQVHQCITNAGKQGKLFTEKSKAETELTCLN